MSQTSSNQLSQELAAISEEFSGLAERMLNAARQLHSPGTPPPEDLLEDLATGRRSFRALSDRARELAKSLHVVNPSAESLDTIQGLTALLDEVAETEIRRDRGEESRVCAISILDRVGSLSHTGDPEFAPLRACQDHAHSLREAIAGASWHDPHAEAEPLAEGDHALANLLAFVENHDELNDDHWASLHDSIVAAFGKPLAIAAARSKLALAHHDESENGNVDLHESLDVPVAH